MHRWVKAFHGKSHQLRLHYRTTPRSKSKSPRQHQASRPPLTREVQLMPVRNQANAVAKVAIQVIMTSVEQEQMRTATIRAVQSLNDVVDWSLESSVSCSEKPESFTVSPSQTSVNVNGGLAVD